MYLKDSMKTLNYGFDKIPYDLLNLLYDDVNCNVRNRYICRNVAVILYPLNRYMHRKPLISSLLYNCFIFLLLIKLLLLSQCIYLSLISVLPSLMYFCIYYSSVGWFLVYETPGIIKATNYPASTLKVYS